jgi:hypothetical protein
VKEFLLTCLALARSEVDINQANQFPGIYQGLECFFRSRSCKVALLMYYVWRTEKCTILESAMAFWETIETDNGVGVV